MIYSFTPFLNELEILEMRLKYLDPIVDKFVIIEANGTHSGISKEFNFLNHKDRFSKYIDKIEYIPLRWPKEVTGHWYRETYQRAQLYHSDTWKNMTSDDYGILSDCDEIPSREVIKYIVDNKLATKLPVQLNILMCHYAINLIEYNLWPGIAIFAGNLKDKNPYPFRDLTPAHYMRSFRFVPTEFSRPKLPGIYEGWHFTYLGGIKRIQYKLKAFSHFENATAKFTSAKHLKNCIKNKVSCCHNVPQIKIDYSDYPAEIIEVAEKYGFIC